MSRKTILIAAPALGALAIGWAAFAARKDESPAPAPRPASAVRKGSPQGTAPETTSVAPAGRAERPSAAPASAPTPETAAIQDRVRKMEDRLRELEAKRDEMTRSNQDLEKQVTQRGAEATALAQAEWRVRAWEKMLGLSESQKQAFLDVGKAWAKEDAGSKAARETWASREDEVRARLTVEQSAKLHQSTADTASRMWGQMGQALGGYAGLPAADYARVQQSIGDYALPNSALLPEAHDADWGGMLREASRRARPALTPEQTARLDKFGWK